MSRFELSRNRNNSGFNKLRFDHPLGTQPHSLRNKMNAWYHDVMPNRMRMITSSGRMIRQNLMSGKAFRCHEEQAGAGGSQNGLVERFDALWGSGSDQATVQKVELCLKLLGRSDYNAASVSR